MADQLASRISLHFIHPEPNIINPELSIADRDLLLFKVFAVSIRPELRQMIENPAAMTGVAVAMEGDCLCIGGLIFSFRHDNILALAACVVEVGGLNRAGTLAHLMDFLKEEAVSNNMKYIMVENPDIFLVTLLTPEGFVYQKLSEGQYDVDVDGESFCCRLNSTYPYTLMRTPSETETWMRTKREFWFNLAQYYFRARMYTEVVKCYNKAIDLLLKLGTYQDRELADALAGTVHLLQTIPPALLSRF